MTTHSIQSELLEFVRFASVRVNQGEDFSSVEELVRQWRQTAEFAQTVADVRQGIHDDSLGKAQSLSKRETLKGDKQLRATGDCIKLAEAIIGRWPERGYHKIAANEELELLNRFAETLPTLESPKVIGDFLSTLAQRTRAHGYYCSRGHAVSSGKCYSHETIRRTAVLNRSRRPYSLSLTKTSESYHRAVKQFEVDLKLLASLDYPAS